MTNFQSKIGATIVTSVAATGAFLAAPTITEAAFGSQNLHFGMQSNNVEVLQETLKEKGFFDYHTATGYFGETTRTAVLDFQRANQLIADGIVGPKTFNALNKGNSQTDKQANEKNTTTNNSSSSSSNASSSNSQSIGQISTNHLLTTGSGGGEVEKLQAFLKRAGFFEYHTVTGYFGNVTHEAVRKYQQARNLQVDGMAGPETLAAINKEINHTNPSNSNNESSGQQSSSNLTNSNAILRSGSQGANVRSLQSELNELGYYNYNVDGIFGSITGEAVRHFQRDAGIPVDGIAGPQTYKALDTALKNGSVAQDTDDTNSNSNSDSSSSTLLQEESRGSSVTELQNRLKVLGHFNQQPTGYFGSVTKNSVIQFQKDWNLVADGLVTQSTWDKLVEVSSIHMENAENPPSTNEFNPLNVVADSLNYTGVPYLWGGTTSAGFDCSGFVQYIFKNNGVNLPRTVAEQWDATVPVSTPKVGDIVYFKTYTNGPSHNGIYIGNNQFIHSGSSTGVTTATLENNSYWSPIYLGARTIK